MRLVFHCCFYCDNLVLIIIACQDIEFVSDLEDESDIEDIEDQFEWEEEKEEENVALTN